MKYERPPYREDAEYEEMAMMFSPSKMRVPKLDYPISVRENFRRLAYHDHPVWMTNSMTEMITVNQIGA